MRLTEPFQASRMALRARLAGRSFWVVRFHDGRVIHEWDRGADWLDIVPRRGLAEGWLVCPSWQVAVLGGHADLTGRLFQFKGAEMRVGLGRQTLFHVLGRVDTPDGACTLYSWEYGSRQLVGPLQDNVTALRYGGPLTAGGLQFAHVGAKLD